METLNLSGSTPSSENRLKNLFWPSVHTGSDIDYLGAQGYWVCTIIGAWSFVSAAIAGHPIIGAFALLIYYLGGVGVRERSPYAAATVLILFIVDFLGAIITAGVAAIGSGGGVFRVLITALLLSNLRATWIAPQWNPGSDEAVLPPRFGDTWSEKFADRFPMWLWPKVRIVYYILSACLLLLDFLGIAAIALRRHG